MSCGWAKERVADASKLAVRQSIGEGERVFIRGWGFYFWWATDRRSMMWKGETIRTARAASGLARARKIISMACVAMAATGWAMVVSGGEREAAHGCSSNASRDMSCGTLRPAELSVSSTPRARKLLSARMAVGCTLLRRIA